MYEFKDTTIRAYSGSNPLPVEALQINGEYIENQITGYRTLYVTGRELLESDIAETQLGDSDGTEFQSKRNVPRTITVGYQLLSDSPEEQREKYNRLMDILDQEQARLVFYDEPDKYFIGTKSDVGDVDSGKLNVTGEFSFYCCDPYKYSMTEKTFRAALNDEDVMETKIINEGTEECAVNYTITHNHENGFVGIASEYGAMQFGDIDELDTETLQRSEMLFRFEGYSAFSAMTNGDGVLTENFPKNGTWREDTYNGRDSYLALNTVGSGDNWHGASKIMYLPEDSSGSNVAQNFYAQTRVWWEIGRQSQTGLLEFVIGDESNQPLASIHLMKNNTTTGSSYAIMKIGTKEVKRITFNSNSSSAAARSAGQLYIKKSGGLFKFYFGKEYQFRDNSMASKKARSVTIFLGQWAGRSNSAKDLVTRMYFDYLFFQKNNVPYERDIPNRYAKGDVMFVDGKEGKMYVNGVNCVKDEIVGTQYFKVPPGETTVQFSYSSFCDPPPKITASITEVYK